MAKALSVDTIAKCIDLIGSHFQHTADWQSLTIHHMAGTGRERRQLNEDNSGRLGLVGNSDGMDTSGFGKPDATPSSKGWPKLVHGLGKDHAGRRW